MSAWTGFEAKYSASHNGLFTCDATSGFAVQYVAFFDSPGRAKFIADKLKLHAELVEALDPDTLDAIADEIGDEFKHTARAQSLRGIAKRQRAVLAKAKGEA